MKNFLKMSLCFLTLNIPSSVLAESAQELLSACHQITMTEIYSGKIIITHNYETGFCWGSFASIQRMIIYADKNKRPLLGVCVPPTSSRTQLIAIFTKYLEDNPQRLHEDSINVALSSLMEYFPCE